MQKFKSSLSLNLKSSKLNLLRKKDKSNSKATITSPMPNRTQIQSPCTDDSPLQLHGAKKVLRTPPSSPKLTHKKRKISDQDPTLAEEKERSPPDAPCVHFGRYKVCHMQKYLLQTDLNVENDLGKNLKCILKGSWTTTDIKIGDIVNILADFDSDLDAYTIDDTNGLIVVNPDHLISSTSIVSSLFCMRKAVLNELFRGIDGGSKTMFVGTLLHELLQECLSRKINKREEILDSLNNILSHHSTLQELLTLQMTVTDIKSEIEPFIPHISYFSEKYILGKNVPVPPAVFSGSSQPNRVMPSQEWPGRVEEIVDIEENIWSPKLGIKGKVDLTVKVNLKNDKATTKVVPIELKTGRASGSAEHKGQVILYNMMMAERRPDPGMGLLLYLRNSSLQEVKSGVHEMRGLIQLRNQLVFHLKQSCIKDENNKRVLPDLPEPLNLKRACGQCPHLLVCSLHQNLKQEIPNPPHTMAELVPQTLDHLGEIELEFFDSWSIMCHLEGQSSQKNSNLKLLWCQHPSTRETKSICVSDLTLSKKVVDSNLHSFTRDRIIPRVFNNGETVIVSTDKEIALSQGVLVEQNENSVTILLDRNLAIHYQKAKFHLDKYEYQGSMSSNLVNLARLMSPSEESTRLRKLIVKKEPVTFLKGLSREVVDKGKNILKQLNKVQQKAIFKTMMAEGYLLIKGMPGTGKTTMIVALIRVLVALGKSLLVSSFTHSAVDTILLKLKQHPDAKFLRLGKTSRINKDLRQFSAEEMAQTAKDLDELRLCYNSIPVVATTCLGLNHPAIQNRTFDYCILDEASQSMLPASLGPLFCAKKFVLVGDPKQLPPVVQNDDAKAMGMDRSLFSYLENSENTIPLNIQYRMNSCIMSCANDLVYEGQLECGNEEVACNTIKLNDANGSNSKPYITKALSANLEDSIVFLNTSQVSAYESVNLQGVVNETECRIVNTLCEELMERGIKPCDIGVISPFRAQVGLIKRTIRSSVDVNTVDQFQGIDKDVIIFSCSRSKNGPVLGSKRKEVDILGDMRRLNVALTRAKCKFILVGNKETLEDYPGFLKFFSLINNTILLTQDEI